MSLLNIMMELKKCCNHPYLFSTAAMVGLIGYLSLPVFYLCKIGSIKDWEGERSNGRKYVLFHVQYQHKTVVVFLIEWW